MYMHCAGPGDCFWTSQILFGKRYKDVSKLVPRWGSNYRFECTRMKLSSRRLKRTYGLPNLESVSGNYGGVKFAALLKPV
jgi:hypothetical protein